MLIPRFQQSGVTLIELIVALSILAILASLAVPSFQGMIMNRHISSTAESILNGLQIARAEAVRRNTQVQFVLGGGSDWTVGCVTVTASCPATIQSGATGDGSDNIVTMTATPAGATTAAFNSFGATIPTLSDLTQLDIDLPASVLPASETHDLRIVVGSGGGVRLCDPNIASPDSRAC
jgi:type IV fimbrial biogenesis protein FimT